MNIQTFVQSYGSALPAQELILLQAAAAYYKYYYDNVLLGDKDDPEFPWLSELDITVSGGPTGETIGSKGSYTVTVPTAGSHGFKYAPVAGIARNETPSEQSQQPPPPHASLPAPSHPTPHLSGSSISARCHVSTRCRPTAGTHRPPG